MEHLETQGKSWKFWNLLSYLCPLSWAQSPHELKYQKCLVVLHPPTNQVEHQFFNMPGITPPGMQLPRNCFHSFTKKFSVSPPKTNFLSVNSSWSRFYIFCISCCCFSMAIVSSFHNFRFQNFTSFPKFFSFFQAFQALRGFEL